jgi:hypothetical protein
MKKKTDQKPKKLQLNKLSLVRLDQVLDRVVGGRPRPTQPVSQCTSCSYCTTTETC